MVDACPDDVAAAEQVEKDLQIAEAWGMWLPKDAIPDCNMQRESALFKKGICSFRQFFTSRHLLALGRLREVILKLNSPYQDWLLLAFSSTLRYTNKMVTRNPAWRGDRPLEWAKPGFWLPPVYLEANVLEEFARRCDAVWRGKRDYLKALPEPCLTQSTSAEAVVHSHKTTYYVGTRSATCLPLADQSVDVIITDPPYGSYVHYADLCNFWSVWLPEVGGLGGILNHDEEAVVARKNFPGAKSAAEYQRLLESCFLECARVLKDDAYMVLTFNNREPRAWAALLIAAAKAGFELPSNGLIFQDGIPSYRHTSQSRREGSVIGDFIFSFRKSSGNYADIRNQDFHNYDNIEAEFIRIVSCILQEKGALETNVLMLNVYTRYHRVLISQIQSEVTKGDAEVDRLMENIDAVQIFDSHRKQLLEKHFVHEAGKWNIRTNL